MERRLGRGLDTLLGGPARAGSAARAVSISVPIVDVRPNPDQPRKVFDSGALEELRDSIQRHGVLQPICIRPAERGYEIVAGERRWRAARMAGLEEIPATVLDSALDERMVELALVENLQREDLDPLEKARGFRKMMDTLDLTQEEVAGRVGMKRATVANHLRLLDLPAEAQEAIVAGLISMGHAKALLGIRDPVVLRTALARTVREGLSVRALELFVRARTPAASRPDPTAPTPVGGRIPPWVRELEGRMRDRLGTRVSLQNRTGYKGQIMIRYHDREELDRLCEILAPKEELK